MKITSIKQQQKRLNRYSIYVDEKYTFSLGEEDLVTAGLQKGQEVSETDLKKFKQDSIIGKAYDRAIRYLALRPRSRWEIEDYLKRKAYDEPVITEVLSKVSSKGYIDDEKFARSWAETRQLLNPRSKKQLSMELRKKRISNEIIDSVLSEFSEDDELSVLKDLITRKQKQTRYQDSDKLLSYLARQGYSYHLIKQALEESS